MLSPLPFALLIALSLAPTLWSPDPAAYRWSEIQATSQIKPDDPPLSQDDFILRFNRLFGRADSRLARSYKRDRPESSYTISYKKINADTFVLNDQIYGCIVDVMPYLDIFKIKDGHAYLTHRSEDILSDINNFNIIPLVPTSSIPHIVMSSKHMPDRDARGAASIPVAQLLILEATGDTFVNRLDRMIPVDAVRAVDLDGDRIMEIIVIPPHGIALEPLYVLKRGVDGVWRASEDRALRARARGALSAQRWVLRGLDALRAAAGIERKLSRDPLTAWLERRLIYVEDRWDDTPHPLVGQKPHLMRLLTQPCRGELRRLRRESDGSAEDWAMLAHCAPREAARRLYHNPELRDAPPEDERYKTPEWIVQQRRQHAAVAILDALARRGTRRHLPALEAARDALAGLPGGAAYADAALDIMLERAAR